MLGWGTVERGLRGAPCTLGRSPVQLGFMRTRKMLLAALTTGALLLGGAAPASATPSPPPAPQQDSVTGNALVDVSLPFAGTGITINATSDASGRSPSGSVSINTNAVSCCTTRNYELGGDVTCLRVDGNQPTIGFYGPVQDVFASGLSRNVGIVQVADNGPAGFDVVRVDASRFVAPVPGSPDPDPPRITDCSAGLPSGGNASLARTWALPATSPLPGWAQDFVVRDAPNVPTSKSQCANGGWREYRFTNQGQCVAYVARGPKTT